MKGIRKKESVGRGRPGRWAAAIMAAVLLTGVLGGCGKGTDPAGPSGTEEGNPTVQAGGKYVETLETLPQEMEGWDIVQIFTVQDKPHLLGTRREEGKIVLREWELQGEDFADVTRPWLASMGLECLGDWVDVQLMQGINDIQYLYAGYIAQEEEGFKGHLWVGEGDEAREITPEKWTVPNEEWGGYEMIQGMAALDDGTLAAVSYNSVDILSGDDGSVLESDATGSFYDGSIITDGTNLYLCSSNESGMEIEIRKDGGSETVPSPMQGMGSLHLGALKDGTLVAAGGDGIFRRTAQGDGGWEKLMEGMDTEFALADSWCVGLAALSDGRLYGLFRGEDGMKLCRYEYDADAVSVVEKTLRLYTVYENPLLKQAAILYHKAHPEVMIDIESVYPQYYDGETDYNAVYQELNTMLLGQDAPDILVMDHLNMDSYASKGLLENVDDILRPMEENGELISGITGAYVQEDGSRYVVPLQFGFCMAMGRDIKAGDMADMEALADFLSKSGYSYMGSQTVAELVDKFYPFFCDEIVRDKQLDREAMGKNLEYLKAIGENCGIVASRTGDEQAYTMWELAAQAKLAFKEVKGFRDCMFPMSMVDYIKGDYTAFGNSFIPSVQMGICVKSEYKDTARDFLKFALSQAVQDRDYYSGFPVNKLSLEKQAAEDRSTYMAATMIMGDDGSYLEFNSEAYPQEVAQDLAALCGRLDKPVKEDAKIREVLIEVLAGYLDGTWSKEEAVKRIEDGLKMYLAE